MYKQFSNNSLSNNDFNVVQYGYRDCEPGFNVYHRRCQNYLFHYVYSGKGTYNVNGKEYKVKKNQGFLSLPGQEMWYTADKDEPFSYAWVEFYGNLAFDTVKRAGLSNKNPIFYDTDPFECGKLLMDIVNLANASPFRLTGSFWLFANALVKNASVSSDSHEELFRNALSYIHSNISKYTTVEDVARSIGITRGYLTKIFSTYIDLSPKQYILRYHMNEAKSLLSGTDMSMSEVAQAVGYDDGVVFSKAFIRIYNISPTEYRKIHKRT
ncbi:MAG: AraC family transcriptional regulator [Clostridia bacterium]|nr:AraC family transcriptional regulator [Clostridia bacterium]